MLQTNNTYIYAYTFMGVCIYISIYDENQLTWWEIKWIDEGLNQIWYDKSNQNDSVKVPF